jgi:hypothetical protein
MGMNHKLPNGWYIEDESCCYPVICNAKGEHICTLDFDGTEFQHDGEKGCKHIAEFLTTHHAQLVEALKILATFPLEASPSAYNRPAAPIYGFNEWKLNADHVRAARAALAACGEE